LLRLLLLLLLSSRSKWIRRKVLISCRVHHGC
jgi:hypothetical protein